MGANVAVSGIVGDDEDGRLLTKSLIDAGASVELITKSSRASTGRTTTLVEEDGGKRFIVISPGVNNHFFEEVHFEKLAHLAKESKIVHLSSFVGNGEFKLQERLANAVSTESLVTLTPGALYAKRGLERLEPMLRHVTAVFLYVEQLRDFILNSTVKSLPNSSDPQELVKAWFAWRKEHGLESPQMIMVKDKVQTTLGRINKGFLAVGVGTTSLERYINPAELPRSIRLRAVDTTGAGDAAAAGFLLGLLHSAPLESCIDSAFLFASFVSTQIGARSAFEG